MPSTCRRIVYALRQLVVLTSRQCRIRFEDDDNNDGVKRTLKSVNDADISDVAVVLPFGGNSMQNETMNKRMRMRIED